MQRLAIPSDYVLQFILGRASYVLPWEDKLCPGNPADDPETGAEEYNAYAIKKAQEVGRATKPDPVLDAVYLALKTPERLTGPLLRILRRLIKVVIGFS